MLTGSARTHAGRVRPQNEDAAVCRVEHGLFAVIDGMGGEEAGEVAAAIAAAAIAEVPNTRRMASEALLAAAFREARERILRQGAADPAHRNMGAVATAIRFDDNGRTIGLAHVGDSRAWLVGAKGVRQLTHDHVQRVEGAAKPAVARDLGRRDLPDAWVETGRFPVVKGDLLVLASDGLHDPVPERELAEELQRMWREELDADAISARLVALALARGGPDNVTVVAVRVGRFRRGRSGGRRLGMAVSLVVFFALLASLAFPVLRSTPPPRILPATLPARVADTFAVGTLPSVVLPAGTDTVVAPKGSLTLRGADVSGVDWTIEVGEGASVELSRTTVRLDGALTILLAKGGRLQMFDSRVDAASVRIVGAEDTTSTLRHVTMLARTTPGPSMEGPLLRNDEDVRLLGQADVTPPAAPTPSAPAPTPTAPTPIPADGVAPR